jgi:hypothetical protein
LRSLIPWQSVDMETKRENSAPWSVSFLRCSVYILSPFASLNMKSSYGDAGLCRRIIGSLAVISFLAAYAGLIGQPAWAQSARNCRVIERKISETLVENTPRFGSQAFTVYMNKVPDLLRTLQARFPNCYISRPNPVPLNPMANPMRISNCQSCMRQLKTCREILADMKSSHIRTNTAQSAMEISCMNWETSCQDSCSGL